MNSTAERTLVWARDRGLATWFAKETTSTNSIAKSHVAISGVEAKPTLFLTEQQTAGRGRGDHSWITPHGALLSTWSYPLNFAPQPILSPLVGLALFTAARSAFPGLPFNLKAPNDLYIGHQKIAGLLIETVMMGPSVTCAVGLGFNAGDPPEALAASAAGLAKFLPKEIIEQRWSIFLSAWIDGLEGAFASAKVSKLSEKAREHLLLALNLNPLLTEPALAVGELGQIQTSSRLINWHEL